jgi:hypothetical protein
MRWSAPWMLVYCGAFPATEEVTAYMGWQRIALFAAAAVSVAPPALSAEAGAREAGDQYVMIARSETYAELFRRALLPGPNGALTTTDTVVPVHQYVLLDARDLDALGSRDSVDVELSAWGRAWFGEREQEEPFDGDVQTANARYQRGPLSLKLGRQVMAGGAARYVRFDGLRVGADLGAGLDAQVYGGLTALPRWDARPGYHHLGSAPDALLREPEALPEPERSGHRLGGGRLGFHFDRGAASVSFHEQHQAAELAHRILGADARVHALDWASFGSAAFLELDSQRLQDLRVWADTSPTERLDLSLEFLHAEPALFLSRQSVLSVFSTDAYDEAGGLASLEATEHITLEGSGFVQIYDADRAGARGRLATLVSPDPARRTLVRLEYGRVLAIDNGYHSVRASLRQRITRSVDGTLEGYAYLYDEPIAGRITSTVYATTLGYQATDALHLLWGGSLAQSPYARLDAQSLLRLSYEFDGSRRRAQP